jgi:hypothetical protein
MVGQRRKKTVNAVEEDLGAHLVAVVAVLGHHTVPHPAEVLGAVGLAPHFRHLPSLPRRIQAIVKGADLDARENVGEEEEVTARAQVVAVAVAVCRVDHHPFPPDHDQCLLKEIRIQIESVKVEGVLAKAVHLM